MMYNNAYGLGPRFFMPRDDSTRERVFEYATHGNGERIGSIGANCHSKCYIEMTSYNVS